VGVSLRSPLHTTNIMKSREGWIKSSKKPLFPS
jgi:hypothetical protein